MKINFGESDIDKIDINNSLSKVIYYCVYESLISIIKK